MKNLFVAALMLLSFATFAQDPTMRVQNTFSKGDIIASTTGRIADGQLYIPSTAGDPNIIGVYSGEQSNRVDRIFNTTGLTEVKVAGADLHVGDWVTTNAQGQAVKATSGMLLGVVVKEPMGGFATIRILISYK